MNLSKVLVIDTETTGLDDFAEILQVSGMWGDGRVAINEYVRPIMSKSWPEAMEINNITPEMVKDKPTIEELKGKLDALLNSADVIVGYNLFFDIKMLEQNGIHIPFLAKYTDVMVPFAKVYGEYSSHWGDYKWQKLITCAQYYGYKGSGWHDSMADVRATLYCFKKMLERGEIETD